MSNVYEALRKAEREGKLRKNWAGPSEAPANPAAEAEVAREQSNDRVELSQDGQTSEPSTARRESEPDALAGESGRAGDASARYAGADETPQADTGYADGAGIAFPSAEEAVQTAILSPISDEFREREKIPPLVRSGREAAIAAEQFQVLRTFIEDWVAEHSTRTFLVTSALRQEGKSFITINLATSLARPEAPVIVVDADCRAPSIHRAFNLTPLAGLMSYLEGRATLAECLHDTHIPGLRVLPAGGAGFGSPEAFAGNRMRRLVDELRALSPASYVLFDAPATLAAPETQILSRLMDAGLLVVAANMTPRKLVSRTMDLLKPMPFCGAIMNRFVPPYSVARRVSYKYGYPERNGNGNGTSGSRRRFGLPHGLFRD